MKPTFDAADVARWATAYNAAVARTLRRINMRAEGGPSGDAVSELSRRHQYLALTAIALRDYGKALGYFQAGATSWAYLLEQVEPGGKIDASLLAEAANGFVLAAASGQEIAIARMVSAYDAAIIKTKNESGDVALGKVLGALCQRDAERASQSLIRAIESSERSDTVTMLRSVIEHDEALFRECIAASAERWRKAIRAERLQKFPDAVCDHWAIGDIRLAERVWGYRPDVDLTAGQIPPEVFDAVAVPVEGTL